MNFDFVFDDEPDVMDVGEKIRVVYCEPGKLARVEEIGTGLKDLQQAVGGLIETYYPFDEEVCIVCNDEGKLNGMEPCRAIYNGEYNVADIVFGPFFICDCRTEEFASLSDEQLAKYTDKFKYPEMFFMNGKGVGVIPYDPTKCEEQSR